MTDFWVYVLPTSGGRFVNECALLQDIYLARAKLGQRLYGRRSYAPDLVLGASGGNIAAYLGLSGDWTEAGIDRALRKAKSEYFFRPWVQEGLSIIPNPGMALFKGTLFQTGDGVQQVFEGIFDTQTITRTEIWTGTYNEEARKAQFFCNRSKSQSLINTGNFNDELFIYDSLPLIYLDGDVENIGKVTMASASIPGFVPPVEINGVKYSDGGMMYSSPVAVFRPEIYRICTGIEIMHRKSEFYYDGHHLSEETITPWKGENSYIFSHHKITSIDSHTTEENRNLRLVYFMPYQPDRVGMKTEPTLISQTIDQLIHNCSITDRNAALDLLNQLSDSKTTFFQNIDMNADRLVELMQALDFYKHYFMILYPRGDPGLHMTKFSSKDIFDITKKVRSRYGVSVWHSDDRKNNDISMTPSTLSSRSSRSSRLSRLSRSSRYNSTASYVTHHT